MRGQLAIDARKHVHLSFGVVFESVAARNEAGVGATESEGAQVREPISPTFHPSKCHDAKIAPVPRVNCTLIIHAAEIGGAEGDSLVSDGLAATRDELVRRNRAHDIAGVLSAGRFHPFAETEAEEHKTDGEENHGDDL